MIAWLVDRFIAWAVRRAPHPQPVVTFDGKDLFTRYEFWRLDEYVKDDGSIYRPLPWWRPINAFIHCWAPDPGSREGFHDHPRWSITVCLKGEVTEVTPWGRRLLRPGSIVIRSRKAIHAFEMAPGFAGETWTLFIVGRRRHRQNTYLVTPR